jgi:hypothetical protein
MGGPYNGESGGFRDDNNGAVMVADGAGEHRVSVIGGLGRRAQWQAERLRPGSRVRLAVRRDVPVGHLPLGFQLLNLLRLIPVGNGLWSTGQLIEIGDESEQGAGLLRGHQAAFFVSI